MRYHAPRISILCAAAVTLPGFVVTSVQAADYLTLDELRQQAFPDSTTVAVVPLRLPPETVQAIGARVGGTVTLTRMQLREVRKGDTRLGFLVSDAVLGKEQMIQYGLALAPDLSITQLEILSYRETHGFEVRNKSWRSQFLGKGRTASLRIGSDIQNISGATLSCTHITDGVRRNLAVLAALLDGNLM